MALVETGVGVVISASHRDHLTGQMHGHSYEIIAWFATGDRDARVLQEQLRAVTAAFDHVVLEDAWGEQLADKIRGLLHDCVEVEVRRPLERIYARAK